MGQGMNVYYRGALPMNDTKDSIINSSISSLPVVKLAMEEIGQE